MRGLDLKSGAREIISNMIRLDVQVKLNMKGKGEKLHFDHDTEMCKLIVGKSF